MSELPENETEFVIYSTPITEAISACSIAFDMVEKMDTGIMSDIGKGRVKRIKNNCLKIVDKLIKDLYEECTAPPPDPANDLVLDSQKSSEEDNEDSE